MENRSMFHKIPCLSTDDTRVPVLVVFAFDDRFWFSWDWGSLAGL